jgi:oligoendopeptidase F
MIYQGVVKRWDYETKLRGYESPISVRNFGNQVPDKAIEVLLEVCAANKDIYQRFFRFKAKELGVPKLQRFDIYAPLEKEDVKIPFDQALKLVDETFARFSPRFVEYARRIVTEKHVDSHPRPNKHGGAFCSTITPKVAPYVLLNYIDNAKEIFTLAHELGHGIHSLYADKHYHSTQDANLPLSETASTFGEMLLFDRMLNDTTDPKIKKSLLAEKMADSFATILRQCYFVKFEIKAHEEIQKGITSETLSDFWLETLHEQFGDAVEVDPIFKYEWANIPHIVNTPFYCYAYSFGDLLTLALYAEYKQKGSGFVPSIEKILEAGGSRNPVEVLSEVGVDIQSKEFWQKSFEPIRDWQEQLEKL